MGESRRELLRRITALSQKAGLYEPEAQQRPDKVVITEHVARLSGGDLWSCRCGWMLAAGEEGEAEAREHERTAGPVTLYRYTGEGR